MYWVENGGDGCTSHTYVASHTFVADSAYVDPNFDHTKIFTQKVFPITPPNLWKRSRGIRDLSENIIIIGKYGRRCRRHRSLKVLRVKKV